MHKYAIVFLCTLIFIIPFATAQDLSFSWEFDSSSYIGYKGTSQRIYYQIENFENFEITCSIQGEDSYSDIQSIPAKGKVIKSFLHKIPDKIKNLNTRSLGMTVGCSGFEPYACGFLWLDTCYREVKGEPRPTSTTIYYELRPQDKANLDKLEDYRIKLSNKVTKFDANSQEFNQLVSQTPTPLLPPTTKSENSNIQSTKNTIRTLFDNVIKALEKEQYNLGATVNPSSDLSRISSMAVRINSLSSEINSNVKKYNGIVSKLNTLVDEVKTRTVKLDFKFNSNLLKNLNELSGNTHSKITSYSFRDLSEADSLVNTFSKKKEEIISQMESNLDKQTSTGTSLLIPEANKICKTLGLCNTKSRIQQLNLENTKNFPDICDSYQSLFDESNNYNKNENQRYQNDLSEFNKKNDEIRKKNVQISKEIVDTKKINALKEQLNQETFLIEEEVVASTKSVNKLGKTVDLNDYTTLVQKYNELPLKEKKQKLSDIKDVKNHITEYAIQIQENNVGFFSFLKRTFYSIFGPKQKLEFRFDSEQFEDIPALLKKLENTVVPANLVKFTSEINNYLSNICGKSNTKLYEFKASILNLDIADVTSDIKTVAQEAQTTCFDQFGKRTTNCCNTNEYRNKEDLYPVIFVHGHAVPGTTPIESINTFNYISDYFSDNGYVERSILYPESNEKPAKGVWAFCDAPIAVRVTYYEGLSDGTYGNYKGSIKGYSPILKNQIDTVLTATNKDKAIIVAHSMGGILSRYYIKFDNGKSKVDRLITLGSPHYGTREGVRLFALLDYPEAAEMNHNSDFLNELNTPNDALVPSYTISGNNNACFFENCDGVVYVSGSQLKSATDSAVFTGDNYQHSEMLIQEDVAKKVLEFVKN